MGSMLGYVNKLLRRAKQRGDIEIIVGDAFGIDRHVIETCDRLGVPVTVYGAYGKFRNRSKTGKNIALQANYTDRDEHMIAECDMCIAVWNGRSKGTDRNFTRAIQESKQAYMWHENKLVDQQTCEIHRA